MMYRLVLLFTYCFAEALTSRLKYNFNPGWKVITDDPVGAEKTDFDDSNWLSVTLPYAWNENDAFRVDIADLSTGIAWYRKSFELPDGSEGRQVYLELEGIRQAGDFYVNEKFVGRSENGVMAFGFDITDFVKAVGTNIVAARIENPWDYKEKETDTKYQWQSKNFYANYGGINKNTFLHVTDPLHQTLPLYRNLNTTGPYIYAKNIDVKSKKADIVVETQVMNKYRDSKNFDYSVTVFDAENKIVLELSGGKHKVFAGKSVTVQTSGTLDNVNLWSWGYGYLYNVRTTLSLNGTTVDEVNTKTGFRKTEFKDGLFKLNDRTLQVKGYAQRSTNEWPSLGSSVPAWLSDFSNKLMVSGNANLVRWMHVTPWKQDIESADRVGLLQAVPAGDDENDATGVQWKQRVELMQDAIVYNRNNPSVIFFEAGNEHITEAHMQEMIDVRNELDPHGGRAMGCREMMDSPTAEYGGEMLYINKNGPGQHPLWSMEYSRDEGARKYWDEHSPPYHVDGAGTGEGKQYNRNQDTHAVENIERWFDYFEQRAGTGLRVNSGGVNIVFSDTNTHHRGNETYRRSGEVDALRLPKEGYFAHQVMWDNWVDVERYSAYIIGHWNYDKNVVKDIFVASTADKVELFCNGKSLGFGDRSFTFLFTFKNVTYEAGTLEAIGYDGNGKKVASNVKATTNKATAIRLTPHVSPGIGSFKADGADIALVDVEVVDNLGRRIPIALDMVSFELSGEATWRGGIAIGQEDNYILSKTLPVEAGINRVILRSTTNAGEVTLKATAEGLAPAHLKLKTSKFSAEKGLATQLPGDGLLSDLSRGPTPTKESYTIKRKALEISEIIAGSAAENATLTTDGHEKTEWSSTSQEPWISYLLAEKSKVIQLVIRFRGFSGDSYPLKVFVDDTEAWEGTTKPNLGYYTLDLEPMVGSNITIRATNGRLRIFELEIYGPV